MRAIAIVAVIIVVGVAIIIGVTTIATQRGLRLWGSNLAETSSGRVLLAQTTVNAVRAHPIVGYGPDNYLEAFRLHRPDRYVDVFGTVSTNNNAHSWVLEYAATLGIPGALLLLAALIVAFVRSRPRCGLDGDDPCGLLTSAIWIGAVGCVVQMMFNVAVLASTVPFWVLLGVISARRARRLPVAHAAGLLAVGLSAVILLVTVYVSGRLLVADNAYVASRLAFNQQAPGDPVALAEKAARLNPLSVKYARAVAQSRSAVLLAAIAEPGAEAGRVRALYDDAASAFEHTLDLSPNDYAAFSWFAGVQAATGTFLKDNALLAASRESARRAIALDRTHWSVVPLSKGDTSASAIRLAESAAGLP